MSRVFGLSNRYKPVVKGVNRTVISYGKEQVDESNATWHELYFYHKRDGIPDLQRIKDAITEDINERTRQRILSTLVWNGKPVWLSTENQMDWKAAFDRALQTEGANLPVKFKLGEADDDSPVYHTFTSVNAFTDFTDTWQRHIQQCLADGWAMKDGMDWSVYESALDHDPVIP